MRGFLFEFRACLDHVEKEIKHDFGIDTDAWKFFKELGTSKVYDTVPEYAFTYHLRNAGKKCHRWAAEGC